MLPYHLLSNEPTEGTEVLIRELAVHLWARLQSAIGNAARWLNRLPPPDRDSLMRAPF